jgi:hypothetical protein
MTNEERDIITRFIERVSGAQGATGFQGAPGGQAVALPPVDREADQLISELFARYPDARYRLTQTAFVQEQALAQATSRIQQLQSDLQQARQAADQAQAQGAGGQKSGGFFSGLFGGGAAQAARPQPAPPVWNQGPGQPPPGYQPQPGYQQAPQYAAPPPQYAAGYQPGMLGGGGGSGFLGSALRTAAGVAGGVVVGNALMNMFEGHHDGGFGGFGGGGYGAPVEGGPWGAPAVDPGIAQPGGGYVDQGTWNTDAGGPAPDSSWTDTSGSGTDSWSDSGGGGGGDDSWSSGGGGGDSI